MSSSAGGARERTEAERRLQIARQLVNKTNFSPQKPAVDIAIEDEALEVERLAANRSKRLQETQKLISDRDNSELYSTKKERQSMTNLMLQNVMPEVRKQAALKSTVKKVVSVLRQSLKVRHSSQLLAVNI